MAGGPPCRSALRAVTRIIKPIALRMVYVRRPRSVFQDPAWASQPHRVRVDAGGASAVQMGTASYFDPVATEKLVDGLAGYCREHRIPKIREITGGMLTD
jgi:dihydroorotate dehydrogenase (NAD+) catalytic subunit